MHRAPLGLLAGFLAAATLALTGCGTAADPPAAPETRSVTTDHGPVDIPAAPARIVVLSGSLAGYAFAVDAPVVATDIRVLGVTNDAAGFPPAWSARATAQGTTPLPGGDTLSVEAVAAARPDLIIGGGQGITAVQARDAYDKLAAIAPTVLVPSTVASWQEQLRMVADWSGRADRVPALMQRYADKVAQVKRAITVPSGPSVFLLSVPTDSPFLIPASAALPALTAELGFTPDDVVAKAGNPPLYGSGDSFELSPELLSHAATAPTAFVVSVGGRTAAQLAEDPLYAQLPAFRQDAVHDLPATSYRPDYDGVMATLDLLGTTFG